MDQHDQPEQHVDAAAAAEALQSIHTTRGEVMKRVGSPPGYYLKLAVATSLITAAQPFDTAVEVPAILIGVALLIWAIWSYSKHTGSMTMATLREPGAWMAWVMIVAIVGAISVSVLTQAIVPSLVAAAVVLPVVSTLGPRWDAAWVRSLENKE